MKTCKGCGIEKELTEYYTQTDRRDGNTYRYPYCKVCARLRQKTMYAQSKAENLSVKRFYKYGLTTANLEHMLEVQENKCGLCRELFDFDKVFHVDHDHTMNYVRGLLCSRCNTGLGKFKDDVDMLQAAINYLLAEGVDYS